MPTAGEAVTIDVLMRQCGVQFGTSGARGLAKAMTDRICYAYTSGFLGYLASQGDYTPGSEVPIAGDLRPSTPRIMAAAAGAIRDLGGVPVNLGSVPTPALALFALQRRCPALMVTGSHIPDDRNGIKFYQPEGEILKADEAGIRVQQVRIPTGLFGSNGMYRVAPRLPVETDQGGNAYRRRYLDFFPQACLRGLRVGLYEHSSVARGLLAEILDALGAELVHLGRSEVFVPVDTEAVRAEDVALARRWAKEFKLDALVSTDGDGDRPLIGDENGEWLRGDLVGVLCARYLGIHHLVTPVSSNSLVERCGWFDRVERTRIGSPYVIDAMQQLHSAGCSKVAGYEANGGFLLADSIGSVATPLSPLPTRDAVVVILAVLLLARQQQCSVAQLTKLLPQRYTCSNRLKDFPTDISRARIDAMISDDPERQRALVEEVFADKFGGVSSVDTTDGLRITFLSEEVVHLRPSGNAPELRCYTEAASQERAQEINRCCLRMLQGWYG